MFDPGSTGFMILGAMLVFLMTPALAFFYGGLSRRKNVLNTMFMSIAVIGFVGVLWIVAGWSFAYGGDGSCPFFGGFDQIFCAAAIWRFPTTRTPCSLTSLSRLRSPLLPSPLSRAPWLAA